MVPGLSFRGKKDRGIAATFPSVTETGETIWKYDPEAAKSKFKVHDMYTLEHIMLVDHIRKGTVLNIAETAATSALTAVMARESAYTEKKIHMAANFIVSPEHVTGTNGIGQRRLETIRRTSPRHRVHCG